MKDFLLARVAVIWADTPKSATEKKEKKRTPVVVCQTKPTSANETDLTLSLRTADKNQVSPSLT